MHMQTNFSQEPGGTDANQDATDLPSFIPLGDAVQAVVLKLKGGKPRLKIRVRAPRREEKAKGSR